MEALEVVSFGIGETKAECWAILNNDEVIAITGFYDIDGDEIADPAEWADAEWHVCGPSAAGYWFTVQMCDYGFTTKTS